MSISKCFVLFLDDGITDSFEYYFSLAAFSILNIASAIMNMITHVIKKTHSRTIVCLSWFYKIIHPGNTSNIVKLLSCSWYNAGLTATHSPWFSCWGGSCSMTLLEFLLRWFQGSNVSSLGNILGHPWTNVDTHCTPWAQTPFVLHPCGQVMLLSSDLSSNFLELLVLNLP